MTAAERTAKFIAELDEVERMTPDQARAECARIAATGGVSGAVASVALVRDQPRSRVREQYESAWRLKQSLR